jgi:hypothetical protein
MREGMPGTLTERLLGVERRIGDAPFLRLVHDNTTVRSFSYRDCLDRARRWSATFQSLDVPPGGRVVIILQHSLDLGLIDSLLLVSLIVEAERPSRSRFRPRISTSATSTRRAGWRRSPRNSARARRSRCTT